MSRNQSLALGVDYALSPTLLADFRFGFFSYSVNVLPFDFGTTPAADAGIPGLNLDDTFTSGLPALFIGGDVDSRRHHVRVGPRRSRQPLQLPARSGREAVADGRQRHEAAGQPHLQVRRRRAARLQPARAERRAPLRRADLQGRSDARPDGGGLGARDVPARRRDAASAATSARAPMRASGSGGTSTTRRTPGARRRS